MIRNATIHDVPRISDIINSHAELGKMLFKSYAQLFEALRDFAVYVDDRTGEVLGCVALSIIWADLTEVRSLAAEFDIRPTKQLGQNFVHDGNTVRKIVAVSGVTRDDVVLEVGPGLGSLTLALAWGRDRSRNGGDPMSVLSR